MARVPVTTQNAVGLVDRPVAAVQPIQKADGFGAGAQELGATLGHAAEIQRRINDNYDNAAVKQAYNAYSEKARTILQTGDDPFYSKQGFNAVGALKDTSTALQAARDELRASLKNDNQRFGFDNVIAPRLGEDVAGIHSYADKQNAVEASRQDAALQVNSADDALAHADDDALYGKYVATGLNSIDDQAKREGWAPETVKAAKVRYQSGIALKVVDGKMTADPVGASEYLHKHAAEFTGDDLIKAQKALYQPLIERSGAAIVDSYPAATGEVAPSVPAGSVSGEKIIAITAATESANRDFNADGKPVTSNKGAQYAMQVMPATAHDPGYGIKPAADGSPAESNRVGRELITKFNAIYGDPAKAWAAYNWSKGGVDKAVAKYGDDWFAHVPPETKAYVSKNVAMLGGSGTYAPRRDDLNGIYQWIEGQHLPYDLEQAALKEADRRVARNDKLLARQQQDARDQAFQAINGLGDGFTSVSQIPADVRRNLSPEDLHSLTTQAEQNVKGTAPKPDGEAITSLHELVYTDPEAFKKFDLRTYRPYMTPGEFDGLNTLQAKMRSQPSPVEQVSHNAIWRVVNFYGRDIGIDTSPKKSSESDDAFKQRRANGQALFTLVSNFVRLIPDVASGKRPPTDDEVKAAYDNAIMPARQADGTVAPRFLNPNLPTNSVAMPQSVHDAIKAKLTAANLPSDDQSVARVYMMGNIGG